MSCFTWNDIKESQPRSKAEEYLVAWLVGGAWKYGVMKPPEMSAFGAMKWAEIPRIDADGGPAQTDGFRKIKSAKWKAKRGETTEE